VCTLFVLLPFSLPHPGRTCLPSSPILLQRKHRR
jgi:hypothetical protein